MTELLGGKYEILDLAGEGGMAKVYKGLTHGAAGFVRPVAIKRVIAPLLRKPEFMRMFVEEARVISELQHPNITQIHDFDRDTSGVYFLVMEWVEGVNLLEWKQAHTSAGRQTPWDLLSAIAIEVLKALHVAHNRVDSNGNVAPIYHRDVTPQNIMISDGGVVKLTDFGLARAMDRAKMTQPGFVKGKISYLSPELTHEAEASPQSDIFSLGVVLWEVLCGGKLFPGSDPVKLVKAIRETHVPPPQEQRPDIPEHLEQIVLKALAQDPADRFRSAKEMARELAMLLRDTTQSTDADQISMSVAWARRQLDSQKPPDQSRDGGQGGDGGPDTKPMEVQDALKLARADDTAVDPSIPLTRKKD